MAKKHVAVTGTKGKTTVTRIIQEIAKKEKMSVFGEYGIDGSFIDGKKITDKFRCAEEYFKNEDHEKCDLTISEATSHVLESGYYENENIDIAIFTGFEETEHSELYDTPDQYLSAKKNIFNHVAPGGVAIVNRDCDFFDAIVKDVTAKIITYGAHEEADYKIKFSSTSMEGSSFSIEDPDGVTYEIESTLWGDFNIQNLTASFICGSFLDISSDSIIQSFRDFPGIKGRSNLYHVIETNSLVVIDYAHTPDSLHYQLDFLEKHKGSRRVVCVFGCGGMKSQEKRPAMGEVAGILSDHIVLTNDNPRDENPRQILLEILEGIDSLSNVDVYPDREEAIKRTLSDFHNSIILIAGKGAEDVMEVSGFAIFMSDTETFEKWVLQNGYSVRGYNDYID